MPTPQELFTAATGDDATVAADKAKLDKDTTQAVSDHAGLVGLVKVPTLVRTADGMLVALLPRADGSGLDNVVLADGAVEPPATPSTAPTPPTPAP